MIFEHVSDSVRKGAADHMEVKPPDKKIISFIRKHHVLALATTHDGFPWCSNMFYAYIPDDNLFVFTSDENTKHIRDVLLNNKVAGSIVLETKIVGRLQGLQLRGIMRRVSETESGLRRAYLKRFPYAAVVELNLWVIEPVFLKFTDNTLGFGKKIYWQSNDYKD